MTITTSPTRNEYTATAGQAVFSYTFKIFADTNLNVYVTPSGQECDDTADITTAYTVSGVGDEDGGAITLNAAANDGDLVTIVSNIPASRTTDYQVNGDFEPATVNDDFDRVVSLVKQVEDLNNRSLLTQECQQGPKPLSLPEPIASYLLRWNADETGLVNVSAAELPVGVITQDIPKVHASVAAMKADLELQGGETVLTQGYYAAGDGGFGVYLISGNQSVDGYGDHLLANNNVALLQANEINVLQFGAVGDNSTDSTAAFMAAVAAVTNYSSFYVPAGRYYVNDTMDFTGKHHFTLRGDGLGVSIIKRTDGAFGDSVLISRTDPAVDLAQGITIRDIQWFAEVDVESGSIIHLKNIQRFTYQNVYLRNYHVGIHTEGVRDSWFDNFECTSNGYFTGPSARSGSCHLHVGEPTNPSRPNTEVFFTNYNFTTAGSGVDGIEDVDYSILIDGEMDGVWLADGHSFGGATANLYINGASRTKFQGLRLSNVYIDQFCNRNIIFTGAASGDYRNFTFDNCRIFGGLTTNITVNSIANTVDISFEGCEIGTNLGNGIQIAGGEFTFKSCIFRQINRSASANAYALQAASGASRLTVQGCEFEMSTLSYGIWCLETSAEYHFHGNYFRGQDGNIVSEIEFSASALVGSCSGNKAGRAAASNFTATVDSTHSNIVTDSLNMTGAQLAIDNLYPAWHERRVTIKADTSDKQIKDNGNFRNKLNDPSVTIAASDMAIYEYSEDTSKWHEL